MLSATTGKLFLLLGGCIHFLRSKCSGVIWYDRATESVRVIDAPFVSSVPKQTTYGFIAKVLPRRRAVCSDATEDCAQEAVQELAAQQMGESSFGDLAVAVTPLCGELPQDEAANADKQVALHKLIPTEAVCADTGLKFLVRVDGERGSGSNKVQGNRWKWLSRLRMRRTQWGQAIAGSSDEASSFIAVLVPVAGGTAEDPCYEMRLSQVKPGSGIPSTADNCDTLEFRNKGTPNAGWYAKPKGLAFHPITPPGSFFATSEATTATAVLPDFPEDPCGDVWVQYVITGQAFVGASNSGTSISIAANGTFLGNFTSSGGVQAHQGMAPASAAGTATFTTTQTGTGLRSVIAIPIGYWY